VAVLALTDIDKHVTAAIRRYSTDRPRLTFADYTGDGSTYALAVPAGWVNAFSWVGSVEYPQGQRPPIYIDIAEVQVYPNDNAPTAILLNLTTPSSGKVARVTYSVLWPIPDGNQATDLIPDTDYEYVAKLAAASAAMQLDSRAAANINPQFPSATLAVAEGEAKRWSDVALGYRKEYEDFVGVAGGPAPASAVIDWDASSDQLATAMRWLFRWPRR
jgi:hypothetical protein